VVCRDAFTALLDQTEDDVKEWRRDIGASVAAVKAGVSVWARSCRLEVDWFIERVSAVVWSLVVDRVPPPNSEWQPADPSDSAYWRAAERADPDVRAHRLHREKTLYGGMTFGEIHELAPPQERLFSRQGIPPKEQRRTAEGELRQILLPVLAWPDSESREEFQTRALLHYRARARLAKSVGFPQYRKLQALERHAAWLLQQRVLGMSLEAIADLAEQERNTRRPDASATAIVTRSVSREIKRLEMLLPL